jgi:hypothetical protein
VVAVGALAVRRPHAFLELDVVDFGVALVGEQRTHVGFGQGAAGVGSNGLGAAVPAMASAMASARIWFLICMEIPPSL